MYRRFQVDVSPLSQAPPHAVPRQHCWGSGCSCTGPRGPSTDALSEGQLSIPLPVVKQSRWK
eukprot:6325985-Pyramimonas_sp.AAC.1